jgi:hypothetical protein
VPARPTVCLPSSLRWCSLSSSRRCRRELSEEGEKADGGGGDRGGVGWGGRCNAAAGAPQCRQLMDYHRRWRRRPELGVGVVRGERRCPEIEEVGVAAGPAMCGSEATGALPRLRAVGRDGGTVGPWDEDPRGR